MVGKRTMPLISQERLKELLDYDPESGVLTWRVTIRGAVTKGMRAGSIDPTKQGYRYLKVDGTDYLAQRLAWFYTHGVWPKILRFKDGNRDNAAIGNLYESFSLDGKFGYRTRSERIAYQIEYRAQRRPVAREKELIRKFGITQKQFEEMLAAQNGVCDICKKPERRKAKNGSVRQMAVDHCHSTGEIRSLLCSDCNQMIGFSCDDPELLEKAAAYVRHHKKLPWSEPTLTEVPLGSMH